MQYETSRVSSGNTLRQGSREDSHLRKYNIFIVFSSTEISFLHNFAIILKKSLTNLTTQNYMHVLSFTTEGQRTQDLFVLRCCPGDGHPIIV